MKKLIFAFLFVLYLLPASFVPSRGEIKRILFIGNSYTGVNNLPQTVYSLALSMGDTLFTDNHAPGGYTFNQHSVDATTLSKIQQGNWDYVVLQEQSQLPSFSPAQVATDCYPYAKKLCDSIRFYNPCAEVLFYMTWGRKNGDAGNCASYPPVCTYAGMQQRLRESYLEMADSNNMSCAPVGAVWNVYRTAYPNVELYQADESHPSMNGTYLAACTFYSSMFHRSSVGATYIPAGVTSADALTIQTKASEVVLDSLENWQQFGNIPRSKFSFTINGNSASFTNQSLRYTSLSWNFGDGSALSPQISPVHVYSGNGTYQVELTAMKDSCLSDRWTDTLIINANPTSLEEQTQTSSSIWTDGHRMVSRCSSSGNTLILFDVSGRKVYSEKMPEGLQSFIPKGLAKGLLVYILVDESGRGMERGKLMWQP